MSTPTVVAGAELARILSDNEDYILSVTKSQAVDMSKEMFQRCVISDSMMDQFSSLDHSWVDPKLQLRYLLRLVTQRIQEDGSVGDKFLSLLESMKEYPLCEYLRGTSGKVQPEVKRMCLDDNLTTRDISWLSEKLAEVSPMWELLGIALDLPIYRIKNMKGDNNMINLCNVLNEWLSGASTAQPTTLRTLTQALRSKKVNHSKLAQEMEVECRSFSNSNVTGPSQLSLTIKNQSFREVQVEDGKSALLMVQASHRENVSYQWNKNGQPLDDDNMYYGVYNNILVISRTHQGAAGEYTCCVSKKKDVVSNKMTLTVLYPPEKKTLLDLYSINTHPLDDEWPPVGTKTFINLVLVNSGRQSVDTNYYYADRVTGIARKIKYGDIFKEYRSASLILVEGCPGSGKTTIVHKIIKDWTYGNALVRASLVFLFFLRSLSDTSQDNTLYSILKQLYTNTGADFKSLVSDLERNNGEGVCFVFDGLDEYHPHMGDKSVVFRLLHKSYLPRAMIIVSSRPGAMARLRQAVVTQHIEVLGFTEDQISEYIDKFPFHDSSDSSLDLAKLKKYLKLHPNVFRMCYLPIHAAIICFVYQTTRGHLPHTQTKIYEEFTRSMILRHLKHNNTEIQLYSLKELPEDTREYFCKLSLLAFNMTVEHKQVINERDISFPLCEDTSPRGDWSLGLVTCNRTAQRCGVSTSHMFLHLTLQEYLAAYHIANTEVEEKRKLIIEIMISKFEFRNVLLFYFGLETFKLPNELEFFFDKFKNNQEISVRCVFESQQKLACNEIVRRKNGRIEFNKFASLSDVSALGYVIRNSTQAITEMYIRYGKYSEINEFIQEIKDVEFPALETLTVISDHDSAAPLWNLSVILRSCAQLTHASFNFSEWFAKGDKYLSAMLQNFPNLMYLSLTCTLAKTSSKIEAVLNQIHHLCQIKTLEISGWRMDVNNCKVMAYSMSHLVNIEDLRLVGNNFSSDSAIHLSSILCHLTKLQILNLRKNYVGSEGADSLSTTLCHLTRLKVLNLSNNDIGSDGANKLSTTLCHLTRLEVIDLSLNNIGSEGAISLASGFCHLTELKEVDLLWNNIDAHSAIQVITALKDCQKLIRLTFNGIFRTCDNMANFHLWGLMTRHDSAIIKRLVAAVRLHKRKIFLDFGFHASYIIKAITSKIKTDHVVT